MVKVVPSLGINLDVAFSNFSFYSKTFTLCLKGLFITVLQTYYRFNIFTLWPNFFWCFFLFHIESLRIEVLAFTDSKTLRPVRILQMIVPCVELVTSSQVLKWVSSQGMLTNACLTEKGLRKKRITRYLLY